MYISAPRGRVGRGGPAVAWYFVYLGISLYILDIFGYNSVYFGYIFRVFFVLFWVLFIATFFVYFSLHSSIKQTVALEPQLLGRRL